MFSELFCELMQPPANFSLVIICNSLEKIKLTITLFNKRMDPKYCYGMTKIMNFLH